jgi:hypothetical protein
MIYCAAQCSACSDIVLAISLTRAVHCSCKGIHISGDSQSSSTNYGTQQPIAFQIEIDVAPVSGVIKKDSDIVFKRL